MPSRARSPSRLPFLMPAPLAHWPASPHQLSGRGTEPYRAQPGRMAATGLDIIDWCRRHRPGGAAPLLLCRDWIDHLAYRGHGRGGKAAAPRMRMNECFTLRKIDAKGLLVGDIAVLPLDVFSLRSIAWRLAGDRLEIFCMIVTARLRTPRRECRVSAGSRDVQEEC